MLFTKLSPFWFNLWRKEPKIKIKRKVSQMYWCKHVGDRDLNV